MCSCSFNKNKMKKYGCILRTIMTMRMKKISNKGTMMHMMSKQIMKKFLISIMKLSLNQIFIQINHHFSIFINNLVILFKLLPIKINDHPLILITLSLQNQSLNNYPVKSHSNVFHRTQRKISIKIMTLKTKTIISHN